MNKSDSGNDENSKLSVNDKKILDELRRTTDQIDKKIVSLINKRFYYSILIGKLKKKIGLSAYSPEREKEINANIKSANSGTIDNETLLRIYERLIDESRSLQLKIIKQKKDSMSLEVKEKINWRRFFSIRDILIIIGFFILLLLLFYYTFFTKNTFEMKAPYVFEINNGESFASVSERLYEEKIIPSKFNFRVAAIIYGAETKLRSARYYIPNNLSYLDLLDLFMNGDADFLKTIRIFDGVSAEWIAGAVNRELKVDSTAFISLVNDKIILDSLGVNANSLEGYLLPGKYFLFERSSPQEVLDHLFTSMNNIFSDSISKYINYLGRTKHQILTMASIIEGETKKVEEMPVIAGVYFNRLRIGMKLQADPTVQYLQKDGWKRLTYNDLKINSPYNTYLYSGLPPGPINNPGKNAILAAIYPAQHNYLYFVADGKGGHNFAKSHTEHLKNVKAYRSWLKTQQN